MNFCGQFSEGLKNILHAPPILGAGLRLPCILYMSSAVVQLLLLWMDIALTILTVRFKIVKRLVLVNSKRQELGLYVNLTLRPSSLISMLFSKKLIIVLICFVMRDLDSNS